jgi:putative transcriptional regulator
MNAADTMKKTAKHDWRRVDALTDAEAHRAAMKDADARPLTDEEFARVRRVPRTRTLRRALGLTQEEFALRYHIPLGTLRDWEQGRCVPDQTAMAYLQVIARDPEGVSRLLKAKPRERRLAGGH